MTNLYKLTREVQEHIRNSIKDATDKSYENIFVSQEKPMKLKWEFDKEKSVL